MQERLWTPTFALIVVVSFFGSFMAQGLSSTVSLFATQLGASLSLAGVLSAIFPIVAVIVRLFCGFIADTRGRQKVMIFGAVSLVLGIIGAGLSPNFIVYGFMRGLQGVGWGAMTNAAATAAADVLPEKRRGEGIGYYGLGQAFSMAIGPAVALLFVTCDPPQTVYYVLGSMSVVAIACTCLVTYEKHPERLPETSGYAKRVRENGGLEGLLKPSEESLKEQVKGAFEGRVWFAMIPAILIGTGYGFSLYYGGYYGSCIGVENAGLYFTFTAVSMITVRASARKFLDQIAPLAILTAACAAGVMAFSLLIAASWYAPLFYVAGFFYGIFLGVNVPLNQSIAVKVASPEHWGMASSAYLIANDVGYIIGLLVWGVTGEFLGMVPTLGFVALCVAMAIVAGWFCYPNHGR